MEVRRGGIALALLTSALAWLTSAIAWLTAPTPASALSGRYAPLDRPGPPLSVPSSKLRQALTRTPGIAGDARNPILLIPGTDLDPGPNYSWNYERAFASMPWAYCALTLPYHTTADIQIAGEYVAPSRIPVSVCAQPFQPGVDPSTFPSDYGNYLNAIGQAQQSAPQLSSEPPLKCYVFASCRIATPPPKASGRHHPKHKHHRKHRHRTAPKHRRDKP